MLNGCDEIDWASMHHAYGTAEDVPGILRAMASPDPAKRERAFSAFYGVVAHQNTVSPATVASMPFLFELAADPDTPDRGAVVAVIANVGRDAHESVAHAGSFEPPDDCVAAVALLRRHAETLISFVKDDDVSVRRSAVPTLGLFVDTDGGTRAATLLRERLDAEQGVIERLLIVEATATLALRLPSVADEAQAWLGDVVADTRAGTQTRLAALAERARCAPALIGPDTVVTAVALLGAIAKTTTTRRVWPHPKPPAVTDETAPPPVVAAFDDLDRFTRVYDLTTRTLRTLHTALAERVALRTELLAEQFRSPAPGARLDAIRMAADLMRTWRGDHSALIGLLATQLGADDPEIAAEAASTLEICSAFAQPAREQLAAHVIGQQGRHGPDAWAHPDPELRRAHQFAARALAALGDSRALPSLLVALDTGVDAWRATESAAHLTEASAVLTPRLCRALRHADLAQSWFEGTAHRLLNALAELRDESAVPAIVDTLTASIRDEHWDTAEAALKALTRFGPAAATALPLARHLSSASSASPRLRAAALAAFRALGGDRDELLALVGELVDADGTYWMSEVPDILARVGAPLPAAPGGLSPQRTVRPLSMASGLFRHRPLGHLRRTGGCRSRADTPRRLGSERGDGPPRRPLPRPHGPGRRARTPRTQGRLVPTPPHRLAPGHRPRRATPPDRPTHRREVRRRRLGQTQQLGDAAQRVRSIRIHGPVRVAGGYPGLPGLVCPNRDFPGRSLCSATLPRREGRTGPRAGRANPHRGPVGMARPRDP
ncbi:HEAT repeat domain-containing protein [Streptodolium elevatio]